MTIGAYDRNNYPVQPYTAPVFLSAWTGGVGSITRVGSTATVSMIGHGFANGASVVIAGAAQSEYNGTFKITVVDANTFTYTLSGMPATPATPAVGTTITAGPPSSIVIAEISDRRGPDSVELQNVGAGAVTPQNWKLVLNNPVKGVSAYYAPRDLSDVGAMSPGGLIAVTDNPSADPSQANYYLGRTVASAAPAITVRGVKSVSAVVRSGSMATVTCAGHGFLNGDVITISGANQPEYNGALRSPSSTPTHSATRSRALRSRRPRGPSRPPRTAPSVSPARPPG